MDTSKDIEKFVMKPDDAAKAAKAYQRAQLKLLTLKRIARSTHRWLPVLQSLHPDVNPMEALERLRGLIVKASKLVQDTREKAFAYHARRQIPITKDFVPSPILLSNQQGEASGTCHRSQGIVSFPTGVMRYPWSEPEKNSELTKDGGDSWTLVRRQNWWDFEPTVRESRIHWSEGVAFEAFVMAEDPTTLGDVAAFLLTSGLSELIEPSGNSLGTIWCLQYTFPAPECDVSLTWETRAYGLFPNGIHAWDADSALTFIEFVVWEQVPAADFPGFYRFQWVTPPDHIISGSSGRIERSMRLTGSMNVPAGQQCRVYVGISIYLQLFEGWLCTKVCTSSPVDNLWQNGLFFLWYAPEVTFSYPQPGIRWVMTPQ